MLDREIVDWIKSEFLPVELATGDEVIIQKIQNARRYWNTHSAFPIVEMYDAPSTSTETVQASGARLQVSPAYKNVVRVYPSMSPDWILQNYPLWTLLGITIIDNLTSDLVMLSEAFRNYRYYIGTDFNWKFQKSDDPMVGGWLYYNNAPYQATKFAIVGTKRLINGSMQLPFTGTTGTLKYVPVEEETVIITNGTHTYTDDGVGNLTSNISGYSGTISYATGVWTVTGWVGDSTGINCTVTYSYYEDIKSEFILDWVLNYTKALVKLTEGNALRKSGAINIQNDGQALFDEGADEKKSLEDKLAIEGRWIAFCRRF
jgi:hypothetical protein